MEGKSRKRSRSSKGGSSETGRSHKSSKQTASTTSYSEYGQGNSNLREGDSEYIDASSVVKPTESDISGNDKELWLFQVPSDLDLRSMDGQQIPSIIVSADPHYVRNPKNGAQYRMDEISNDSMGNLFPLVWSDKSEKLVFGPHFERVVTLSRELGPDDFSTAQSEEGSETTWRLDTNEPSINGLRLGRSPKVEQVKDLRSKWIPIGANAGASSHSRQNPSNVAAQGDISNKEKKSKKKKSKKEKRST